MSYQCLKEYIGQYAPLIAVPMSGAIAGFLAWVPIYQIDTVKTIFQSQDLNDPKIKTYADLWKFTKENHNIKSLTRGFWVAANRSMVVSSVGLLVWEEVLECMERLK